VNRADRRRCSRGRRNHIWVEKVGYGVVCSECGAARADAEEGK
jgi:hypothetical protein